MVKTMERPGPRHVRVTAAAAASWKNLPGVVWGTALMVLLLLSTVDANDEPDRSAVGTSTTTMEPVPTPEAYDAREFESSTQQVHFLAESVNENFVATTDRPFEEHQGISRNPMSVAPQPQVLTKFPSVFITPRSSETLGEAATLGDQNNFSARAFTEATSANGQERFTETTMDDDHYKHSYMDNPSSARPIPPETEPARSAVAPASLSTPDDSPTFYDPFGDEGRMDDFDDDRTLLDIFGQVAREYLTKKVIPKTDASCRWDWRSVRCEPVCNCTLDGQWGDYHLGRSCRLRPVEGPRSKPPVWANCSTLVEDKAEVKKDRFTLLRRLNGEWLERPVPKRLLSLVRQTIGILQSALHQLVHRLVSKVRSIFLSFQHRLCADTYHLQKQLQRIVREPSPTCLPLVEPRSFWERLLCGPIDFPTNSLWESDEMIPLCDTIGRRRTQRIPHAHHVPRPAPTTSHPFSAPLSGTAPIMGTSTANFRPRMTNDDDYSEYESFW